MNKNDLYHLPDSDFMEIYENSINWHEVEYLKRIYNRMKYKRMKEEILKGNYNESILCI